MSVVFVTLAVIVGVFGLLMLIRPDNAGAGSMSERWLEEQRASHSD